MLLVSYYIFFFENTSPLAVWNSDVPYEKRNNKLLRLNSLLKWETADYKVKLAYYHTLWTWTDWINYFYVMVRKLLQEGKTQGDDKDKYNVCF